MRLFVLLPRFPYPLEKGDKLRAFYQIKELQKQHKVHLYCLSDVEISPQHLEVVRKHCESLHLLKLSKLTIAWNLFLCLFSQKPFQAGYFFCRKHKKTIHQAIKQIKPNHIYCQLIRTTEYVKDIHNIPKTLDFMDALGEGMKRRASLSKGLKKIFFNIEASRLKRYEHIIFDYFNYHTIISNQDRELISHPSNHKIQIVENGISDPFFEKIPLPKEWDLLFVGNMSYAPNVNAAKFIVKEILPALEKKGVDAKVLLSGANPNTEVLSLAERNNVSVTGWVDDIRASYASSKVFLAPLFIGSGLQNKLLEAMAQGLPCITTPLANNALRAENQRHLIVAKNKEEFASCIENLLSDENKRLAIGEAGRTFVHDNFSWSVSVEKLNYFLSKK